MTHYVYVLRCGDDSFYTGYTTDVERRLAEHRRGDGAKYTRGRGPLALVHVEAYGSRSAAMSREYEVKQFTRARKERLVAADRGATGEFISGDGATRGGATGDETTGNGTTGS